MYPMLYASDAIGNGATEGGAIVAEITADVGVASGAEVRLGWAVNNGTPQKGVNGPANFANHQQF